MPGLRPERPGAGSDGGHEHLETLADALFPTSKEGMSPATTLFPQPASSRWRLTEARLVSREVPAVGSCLTPGFVVGPWIITFGRDVESASPFLDKAFGGGLGTDANYHSEGHESGQRGNQ
jgi:hypothetical protein